MRFFFFRFQDDKYLPAGERQPDQTQKAPTGPLKREKLLKYLEDKAKAEKDWDEKVPYEKKTRGRVWTKKELAAAAGSGTEAAGGDDEISIELDEEFEEALKEATEKDWVDLAAILGFHSMLNQAQYHAAYEKLKHGEEFDGEPIGGDFHSIAKGDKLKFVPHEPNNATDVDKTIDQV